MTHAGQSVRAGHRRLEADDVRGGVALTVIIVLLVLWWMGFPGLLFNQAVHRGQLHGLENALKPKFPTGHTGQSTAPPSSSGGAGVCRSVRECVRSANQP